MKSTWPLQPLAHICEFHRGLTYSKSNEIDFSDNIVLRANNIDLATNTLNFSELKYIEDSVVVPAAKKARKDSILICTASGSKSHLGKAAYIDDDYGYAFGGFMGQLTPNSSMNGRYLFHALTTPNYKDFIRKLSDGANINNLKFDDLKQFTIPVPPLPEQRRIVAILDQAFAAIATARAHTEQNLRNARELFESQLAAVFSQRGAGWVETTLGKASGGVFTGPFGSLLHKSDYIENGIPLINPAHITRTGITPDWSKTVSQTTAERLSNYLLSEGDLVIGRRGEMGRCALVTSTEDGWLCGTGSFIIKKSKQCDGRYLLNYLRSASCKQRLKKMAGGAVMPNLSNTDLGNLSLLLPPLKEQASMMEKIDALHQQSQTLQSLAQRKLAALDELKQSLLQQAFSGQL